MRMGQGVRTCLGHGGITCVLQTQFSSLTSSLYFIFQHVTEAFRKTYTGQNKTANISASVWKIH